MRIFTDWLSQFRTHICDFDYYVDFAKVYKNIDCIKVELNILNSLIGSKTIEKDFRHLVSKYPQITQCIPLLLAIRGHEVQVLHCGQNHEFSFRQCIDVDKICLFMRQSGLFDLISNRIIASLVDYATGIEVGLDSNCRKNRGGKLMEKIVEQHIFVAGFKDYHKEMTIASIEQKYKLDLSTLSNKGKSVKRFDFVIKTQNCIYAIETNFYASGVQNSMRLLEVIK